MSKIPLPATTPLRPQWNKGRLIGQKRPLLPRQVWAIRASRELASNLRDLTLLNLAIDSRLRGCDLVRLKVGDLVVGGSIRDRVSVIRRKSGRPVQFQVSQIARKSVLEWVSSPAMLWCGILYPSRSRASPHLSTRQYARLVGDCVSAIGLDPGGCGMHSLRRTRGGIDFPKDRQPQAVRLLHGHTNSTMR